MTKVGSQAVSIRALLLCLAAVLGAAGCNNDGSSSGSSSSGSSSLSSLGLSISGQPPQQAAIGQVYSFTPAVKAAAGSAAAIGFSIRNKPTWASFNTASGRLDGTPGANDVGSYPGIVISASSGSAQASLGGFTITVLQKGAVLLSWDAPTTNTDGSPLADLAGYTIHYGTIESLLTQSVTVDNPNTSYAFQNLAAGVWYFAISAVTSAGIDGAMSDPVSATIN